MAVYFVIADAAVAMNANESVQEKKEDPREKKKT